MAKSTDLQENNTDKRAKAYRAIAGIIPGGSFVTEYLINHIPEQRLDRLIEYLKEVDARISKLETQTNINDPRFVELFEESIEQAARSRDRHRGEYLTNIIIIQDPAKDEEWDVRLKLLRLLRELTRNDIDLLIEMAELPQSMAARPRRSQVLYSKKELEEWSDQKLFQVEASNAHHALHVQTLETLGLVESVTKVPDFTSAAKGHLEMAASFANAIGPRGKPIVVGHQITKIGKLLVGAITGKYPR